MLRINNIISRCHARMFLLAGVPALFFSCTMKEEQEAMQPVQLTDQPYGHMLNSAQVFSPDGQWIVYDTRNDDTHISRTCCIERVNFANGKIVRLYHAPNQTVYGPGVGAVAYHPRENKMIFIHGLLNCDETKQYGFTRRFGAILDETSPGQITHAEARSVDTLIAGALRGGTHAYSWSADGTSISFTYNDALMAHIEREGGNGKDLRTIGVMRPIRKIVLEHEDAENFSGNYFSVVAATVLEKPTPGSDEIEKAFDECWIGREGYVRPDGTRQKAAIAFQGHVRTTDNALLTEVFVSDIPADITIAEDGKPLSGTPTTRPAVPAGLRQRRITFTGKRKYPGIQGPRCWLRASPDGTSLYFLMKDDQGIVQVYAVSPNGGDIRQVTDLPQSVQAQFNVSPDGSSLAIISGNSIWLTDVSSGDSRRLTAPGTDGEAPVMTVVWNPEGNALVYNAYVKAGDESYLQLFKLHLR